MLQRLQTIFLLLAVLVNAGVFLLPSWTFTQGNDTEQITAWAIQADFAEPNPDQNRAFFEHTSSSLQVFHMAYFALTALASVYLLFVIFQFQDRMRQKRLAYIGIFLLMLELGAMIGLSQQGATFLQGDNGGPYIGLGLPIAAIILIYIAINRIQKDEDLIKSIDRIR